VACVLEISKEDEVSNDDRLAPNVDSPIVGYFV
jgi:hypothetical protein